MTTSQIQRRFVDFGFYHIHPQHPPHGQALVTSRSPLSITQFFGVFFLSWGLILERHNTHIHTFHNPLPFAPSRKRECQCWDGIELLWVHFYGKEPPTLTLLLPPSSSPQFIHDFSFSLSPSVAHSRSSSLWQVSVSMLLFWARGRVNINSTSVKTLTVGTVGP